MSIKDEMLKAKADVLFYEALKDGIIKAISESVGDKDYCYISSDDDIQCTKIMWGEHLLNVMRSCQEAEERLKKIEAEQEAAAPFTLISDEDFDNLEWEHRKATDLVKELDGYTIADIEPIIDGFRNHDESDPIIGGVDLYLTRSDREEIKIISLVTEVIKLSEEEDGLKMDVAYYSPNIA